MKFMETPLAGAYVVDAERRSDERGHFARVFCEQEFERMGLAGHVAQANASVSLRRGTLRGLHFQYPPAVEAKFVRCTSGAVLDVIVDLRPESPTFLDHFAIELDADTGRALYVPGRFAHGFQTLRDGTTLFYQASTMYSPDHEGGLRHDDPRLGVSWPLPVAAISEKDRTFALLETIEGSLARRMLSARTEPRVVRS